MRELRRLALIAVIVAAGLPVRAQDYDGYSDTAIERELAKAAEVEALAMIPMRDGVRLATNIYRPREAKGPLPTLLSRTPYSELPNKIATSRRALEAVKRGYAYVVQNERGRYFSEGSYEILGRPQTDGYDTLTWIAKQPWSNGKVGTVGCSSSAEWQLALAAQRHPAHAAMTPMAFGAGIGKVGPFWEQGSFYMGGVPRTLSPVWLYGVDNPVRAQLPPGADQAARARISTYRDADAIRKPPVSWQAQIRHLPYAEVLTGLGEPPGVFEAMINRDGPADPAWRKGGLYTDDMGWGVPALWFSSWYDITVGPNIAMLNQARAAATDEAVRSHQYAIIGPNTHCAFDSLGPNFRSGDRDLGDATFRAQAEVYAFLDRWLKGDKKAFDPKTPPVRFFTMGANRWQSATQWPPKEARVLRLYLRSGGRANSLWGDGRLDRSPPSGSEPPDRFVYDPMNPAPTVGGGDCCNGGLTAAGALDQRPVEARSDVLVYTSGPLTSPLEVTGFVETVLKVSSDAKDTDFAVKLVDVAPDGAAYILGDTILRARYRDGYDKPAPLEPGKVYALKPTPITTSNTFLPGHRIRVEVTSSNFPKFVRNLNTGGRNEHEAVWKAARNTVHHAGDDASYVDLPVVDR